MGSGSWGILNGGKSYLHLGSRMLATLTPGEAGDVVHYHHPDRLGIRLVTNVADTTVTEQVTLPFGVALDAESTGATNPCFTSYDRSTVTGLDYAQSRYYDSDLGRFTQVDPLGMGAANQGNRQSLNMYAYVQNDPVNSIDPTGTTRCLDVMLTVGPDGKVISAECRDPMEIL
jgi:RHS repeat-associated protein